MTFLQTLANQNKALIGGALVALPGINTVLNAVIAYAGIGVMPLEAELQDAINQLVLALGAYIFIYLIPNWTPAMQQVQDAQESVVVTPVTTEEEIIVIPEGEFVEDTTVR